MRADQDMQEEIDNHISAGRAIFNVLLLKDSSEGWELATLILKRAGYQIKTSRLDFALKEEKYSPDLSIFNHVLNSIDAISVVILADQTSLWALYT
ncbi:hypothetical protein ACLOJK_030519, partial [Asimina triloba]